MSHEEHIYVDNDAPAKGSNLFVRILVIIGIILILLFIALTIVKYVPRIIGAANVSFSSLFKPKDKMTVSTTAPQVKSGEAFTVNWKNNTTDSDGSYMWTFSCVDGITVLYNSISGERPVICDTLFPLPDNKNSYSFLVKNAGNREVTLPMTVSFWDVDLKNEKFAGSSSIVVLPEGSTTNNPYNPDYNNPSNGIGTTTPNSNNGTYGNGTVTTNPNNGYYGSNSGTADLRVSLLKIGRVNSDGSFEETTSFRENDRITVRFNVANVGTARSGTWSLQANLPTKTPNDRVFNSGPQPALNPGDLFELTISFDAFDPNGRFIQIIMLANDKNQSNNNLSIPVSSSGGSSSTGSRPDLVVKITDVGTLGSNNQFYYNNSLDEDDEIAVRFEVKNIGGSSTGSWRFEAELPTEDGTTFRSGNQSSLAPGEVRIFTIGFDNPETGENDIVIEVDSDDDVDENNENNNDDREEIDVDN